MDNQFVPSELVELTREGHWRGFHLNTSHLTLHDVSASARADRSRADRHATSHSPVFNVSWATTNDPSSRLRSSINAGHWWEHDCQISHPTKGIREGRRVVQLRSD